MSDKDEKRMDEELVSAETRQRRIAVEAMAGKGGEAAAPFLVEALKDPDPDIRAVAASGLARLGRSGLPFI